MARWGWWKGGGVCASVVGGWRLDRLLRWRWRGEERVSENKAKVEEIAIASISIGLCLFQGVGHSLRRSYWFSHLKIELNLNCKGIFLENIKILINKYVKSTRKRIFFNNFKSLTDAQITSHSDKTSPFPSLDMQQEKCAKTTCKTRQPDRQIAPVARITQAKTDNQSLPPLASRRGNGMNYHKAQSKKLIVKYPWIHNTKL